MFVYEGHDEAPEGRQGEREHAVAQDAHALEEGNGSTQQLCIQGDCCRSTPDDHEDCSKDQ